MSPTPAEPSAPPSLATVLDESSVLLCCGTGGVGKTTTAASLALAAAQRGRRVVVVTIDPARRLADALGLDGIGDTAVPVDLEASGRMWVTMLDTKAMFDRLIETHAADAAQAERILTNRYYRNLSGGLSGTQEFMAIERLHELVGDDRFDLVVVDTPPSRNALDFLDAPDRLARFLDGRLFRLAAPGRRLTRKLTAPVLVALRRVARVVSPEVVDDTFAFIEAFSGMEDGFRQRAAAVETLFADRGTAFVVITSAMAEAIDESRYFAERLGDADLPVRAVVVNRLQPRFGDLHLADVPYDASRSDLEVLAALTALADEEEKELAPLLARCPDAAVARIPQLDHDVHDLAGITEVSDLLVSTEG